MSTGQHEDRMDSFVLAETFKYLYLLFDSTPHSYIDIDQFIFTTEAHLIPMNFFLFTINDTLQKDFYEKTLVSARLYEQKNLSLTAKVNDNRAKHNQCPAMDDQFKSHEYKERLRQKIRGDQDMTETVTTKSRIEMEKRPRKYDERNDQAIFALLFLFSSESHRRLSASEFSAADPEHVAQLAQMGIQIQTMSDGRKTTLICFLFFDLFILRCSIDS